MILLALMLACTCSEPVDQPRNVLVILADDLGVDNVGSWGVDDRAAKTPVIDALAADGVRFRNAWAYPECSPTRAALLTGRYGRRNGVGQRIGNQRVSRPFELPPEETTIPEVLGQGWATAAVGKWHLTNENTPGWERAPNKAGFDWFSGPIGNLDAQGPKSGDYFRWRKTTNGRTEVTTRYATSDTTDDALLRIAAMPEPWFVYAAYAAPHAPFHQPPAELAPGPQQPSIPGLYRSMVQAMDTEIGRLLSEMDPEVRERTTVILLGDNGTPRDAVLPPQLPERAKNSLYEGGIRVPFIVSGAGVTARGAWSDALVHAVDVLPTVVELAGARAPERIDGVSVVPALRDPEWAGRDVLYAEMFAFNGPPPWFRDQRAVRDARHKLIRTGNGVERMFDLQASGNPLLEGEDLLVGGDLTPAQHEAYVQLGIALDRLTEEIAYEY